jgi:toxin ParE1/3/4
LSENLGLRILLSGPAKRDIAAILKWSWREFGEAAAWRYEALLSQAMRDIAADPERPGSLSRPEIVTGGRTYHLQFSRENVGGDRVKAPRHLLLYRRRGDAVEIARVLHDAQDLKRNLPSAYRG